MGVLVFIGVLVAGLLYEWRQGALDWVSSTPSRRQGEIAPASKQAQN
jgi:hypothetical protein